jgi:hypothetical protein
MPSIHDVSLAQLVHLLRLFRFLHLVKDDPARSWLSCEKHRIWVYMQYLGHCQRSRLRMARRHVRTVFPRTERYVPSAAHRATFLQYPLTRHLRSRLASPSQLSRGRPKRCMYFFSCARMETALDMARKDSACDLHQEADLP